MRWASVGMYMFPLLGTVTCLEIRARIRSRPYICRRNRVDVGFKAVGSATVVLYQLLLLAYYKVF